jgi:hypothetical protein
VARYVRTNRVELMPRRAERILRLSPTYALEHCVPVTARLSKRLYDVLGEDVANELVDWFNTVDLTYRADFRELNELNYARFEAKLEQRLAELRAELLTELRTSIAGLRTELVRWMFGFWVTTLIGIAGLLIALRGN